jgi:hypothetical protein
MLLGRPHPVAVGPLAREHCMPDLTDGAHASVGDSGVLSRPDRAGVDVMYATTSRIPSHGRARGARLGIVRSDHWPLAC